MPGRKGYQTEGGWAGAPSKSGAALAESLTVDARNGSDPLEYKASEEIDFIPNFSSSAGDAFEAYITEATGGGSTAGGTIYGSGPYRYGFNGKEQDDEVKGEGNQQDYGMRIYDNRLGRFLSVDPITKEYPELTPYQFASNTPILGIDRDGLEFEFHRWLFDIWMEWKFGDPTGSKTLMSGTVEKAQIESKQTTYHNSNVPISTQRRLDKVGTTNANAKIASGTAQVTTFVIKTSIDVASNIAPIGEGIGLGIQGARQLSRVKFATKVYEGAGITGKNLASHLKYYDFEQKVYNEIFEKGKEFIQYRVKWAKGTGDYYAPVGTKPQEIGIDPSDVGETFLVTLDKEVKGLVSSHKRNTALYYDANRTSTGGGTQIYSNQIKGNATFKKIPNPK